MDYLDDIDLFIELIMNSCIPDMVFLKSVLRLDLDDYRVHYYKAHYYQREYTSTWKSQCLMKAVDEIECSCRLIDSVNNNLTTGRNIVNGSHLFINGALQQERVSFSKVYHFAGELYAVYGDYEKSKFYYVKFHLSNKIAYRHYKTLFSFRAPSCYSLSDLKKRTITVCHPSVMNDPFDSLALSWSEILDKICKEKIHVGPLRDSYEYYRIRSFCSGKKKDVVGNILMWSHYADSHKGYCIEYEFDEDFERSEPFLYFRPVQYAKKSEQVNLTKMRSISSEFAFFVKHTDWRYEKEVRLLTYNPQKDSPYDSVPLRDHCRIKSIYFGLRCAQEVINKIVALLGCDVKYFRMTSDYNDIYRLKPVAYIV